MRHAAQLITLSQRARNAGVKIAAALMASSVVVAVPAAGVSADSPRPAIAKNHNRAMAGSAAPIPGGRWRSVLPTGTERKEVMVAPFSLDRTPVTNAQFLAFVRTHPEWRRDRVPVVFADSGYLQHWSSALGLGANVDPEQPVTGVSWFAARAYCESHGARLPNWYEWEKAAAADETERDARNSASWKQKILTWYSRPSTGHLRRVAQAPPNVYGIHDLHGLVWEWVEDFNALMISGDNRTQGDPDLLKFCGSGALSIEDRESYATMMRLAMLSSLQPRDSTANLGFRCATAAAPNVQSESHAKPPLPGDSLYQLEVPLETSRGQKLSFAELAGRARIVTMFYASCPMACPLIIDTLRAVDRELTPAERGQLDVLLVTLDPENDSPAALQKVVAERRIDDKRWSLGRASPGDTRKLAAALGIQFRELNDGSFNHASVLVLLDAQGRVIARSGKMGRPDPAFLASVRSALGR